MKPVITAIFCAVFSLAILATGCAKPPTEEMNNAIEAVTRAENDSDAVAYAADSISRARDALAQMHTEAASKRYDAAKSYAAEAIAAAERAISEGRAGAARAKDEATALVAELKNSVDETEQAIVAAQSAGLDLDFDSIIHDFDTVYSNVEQAKAAVTASHYQDALKIGRAARSDLAAINQKLSSAAIAVSRKK
ncbi:MAG: DUF4398 domain-containing protein [Treponema sp.]|nr:DUF4398 domain-containing protein [Treponema sp.]